MTLITLNNVGEVLYKSTGTRPGSKDGEKMINCCTLNLSSKPLTLVISIFTLQSTKKKVEKRVLHVERD